MKTPMARSMIQTGRPQNKKGTSLMTWCLGAGDAVGWNLITYRRKFLY
jgi:hypothetical protein